MPSRKSAPRRLRTTQPASRATAAVFGSTAANSTQLACSSPHWIAVVANRRCNNAQHHRLRRRGREGRHDRRRLERVRTARHRLGHNAARQRQCSPLCGAAVQGTVRAANSDGSTCPDHARRDRGRHGRGALAATIDFVRNRSRPWKDAGVERAADDPYTVAQVGEVKIRVAASDALLERAGAFVDEAARRRRSRPLGQLRSPWRRPRRPLRRPRFSPPRSLSSLPDRSATLAEHGLDRFWRNARTHTVHDPVRWKYGPSATTTSTASIRHGTARSDHGAGNPLQRLRHELRRPPVAGPVGASARPVVAIQGPRLLDRSRPALERGMFDGLFIADVLGVYDVYDGSVDDGAPAVGANPGQRSPAARAGDGAGHRASRLRAHRLDCPSSTPTPSPAASRRSTI